MYIDKNSIVIDGISMGDYITGVTYEYHKLWGSDTGRNSLDGSFNGTFKGVFPKFVLKFRRLTKSELELLEPILDSAEQTFTYYDPKLQMSNTIKTYNGDWQVENNGLVSETRKNSAFEMGFIAKKKR